MSTFFSSFSKQKTTNLFKSYVALFIILFFTFRPVDAAVVLRLTILNKPADGIKKIYVSHSSSNQKAKAVVVLVDVYNQTERPVLQGTAKTAFDQMVDDVQANELAFCHVEINEDGSLSSLMEKKKGVVGSLVMKQIRDLYGEDVRLCLYPANKGAVPVVSNFLNQFPEQIGAWCFFNNLPEGSWNKKLAAPGIIASQNNHASRAELEAAFKEGRNLGKSWTWLEFNSNNTSGFQSFLWQYFAESVKRPEGTWMVTETKTKATTNQLNSYSPDLTWLPSEALGSVWASLQAKHIVQAQTPTPAESTPPPPSQFPEITLEGKWQGTKGVYITHSLPKEKPLAAVVLIDVYNRKTRSLRKADAQATFAEIVNQVNSNRMAFIHIDINEDGSLFNWMQSKEYKAKRGISTLILQQVRQVVGEGVPLCFYPRRTNSFRICSEIFEEYPEQIAAWATYNSVPPQDFAKGLNVPGLVASGNDHVDLEKFKEFFEKGRDRGQKLAWMEVKPSAEKDFQSFVWSYFASAAKKTEPVWMDLSTAEKVAEDAIDPKSQSQIYLPSTQIAQAWSNLQSRRVGIPTVLEKIVEPKVKGLSPISFYLRLPPGAKDGTKLSGVIAYCTWVSDRKALMQQLLYDTDRPEDQLRIPAVQMLKYASEHNLAVLNWSTPGKWSAAKGSDELARKELKKVDDMFDDYAAMWEKGVAEFVKETGIPDSDYLLYGFSRGAQWAHRLALRKPQRFWAINIHVNSSYDIPTPLGSECLWLVTTGDLEHGYAGGKRFYSQCMALGYPMIFKAQEKLGHSSCKEVETLRDLFFDFAREQIKEREAKKLSKQEMAKLVAERLKQSPFIGDYLNQEVFEASDAEFISPSLRVYLPNELLAQAWKAKYTPETVK